MVLSRAVTVIIRVLFYSGMHGTVMHAWYTVMHAWYMVQYRVLVSTCCQDEDIAFNGTKFVVDRCRFCRRHMFGYGRAPRAIFAYVNNKHPLVGYINASQEKPLFVVSVCGTVKG